MNFIIYFWVSLSSPAEVLLPTIFTLFIQVSKSPVDASNWPNLSHILNRAARKQGEEVSAYLGFQGDRFGQDSQLRNFYQRERCLDCQSNNYKITIAY